MKKYDEIYENEANEICLTLCIPDSKVKACIFGVTYGLFFGSLTGLICAGVYIANHDTISSDTYGALRTISYPLLATLGISFLASLPFYGMAVKKACFFKQSYESEENYQHQLIIGQQN